MKPEWRKLYTGCIRGRIIQGTSLGIAVKVRFDESGIETWIAMDSIQKETRR